jgi:MFS family permease
MFCVVDRVNIGLARVINYSDDQGQLERDLLMSPDQYNWAVSVFYIGYILFEVPSNLLLHHFSPRIWISRIAITWGICASCMAAVNSVAGLYISRIFLGLFEAGLVPGISYYLSTWYKKNE